MSRSDLSDDQESLHLAKMLIEEHGPDAARYARSNADRLSKVQDCDGRDSWMRIAKAVDSLLELQDADTVH
jgi:hypothetical protein